MKSFVIASFVVLTTTVMACGQQNSGAPQKTPPAAKTKLETFADQQGVVIIKGYSKVGTVKGQYGTVEVQAQEFTNAASGKKERGIVFEVTEARRLERENRSFIDFDEIDSLLKGIDYVSKIDKSSTKLDAFEAEYRTKGELEITTFSRDPVVEAAVKSGRIGGATAFLTLENLLSLRALIVEAKAKLDVLN